MQLTRLELYELVSKSPLSKVAPTLGISATSLAAICTNHSVPYPGSAYWTKKSLGQEAWLPPLPDIPKSDDKPIDIAPPKPRAKRKQVQISSAAVTPVEFTKQGIAGDGLPIAKIKPIKRHPIIVKWLSDHERRRREAVASRDPWRTNMAPAAFSEIDHRRHRFLEALFHALEVKGATVSEADKGLLRVTIDGEKIDFQVREKNRQVRNLGQDKQNSYRSQELVGTGKLVFAIRTYLRGPFNEEWRETEADRLENQLPRIVDRLFEGAAILKAWHVEQELERQKTLQEAAQRAERARLRRQEQDRRQKLIEISRDWNTSKQI